ncbi:hypothetical protein BZA77DRAFT_297275 [Pyronema omphalodes]|nr:hypothetical protein BZA77DRAFT_297275 [Pyronema omphalodes]
MPNMTNVTNKTDEFPPEFPPPSYEEVVEEKHRAARLTQPQAHNPDSNSGAGAGGGASTLPPRLPRRYGRYHYRNRPGRRARYMNYPEDHPKSRAAKIADAMWWWTIFLLRKGFVPGAFLTHVDCSVIPLQPADVTSGSVGETSVSDELSLMDRLISKNIQFGTKGYAIIVQRSSFIYDTPNSESYTNSTVGFTSESIVSHEVSLFLKFFANNMQFGTTDKE